MPEVIEIEKSLPMLNTRAAVSPGTLNVDKRTVDVVFGTDAPVLMGSWDQYYESLLFGTNNVRFARLNAGAPLLDNHYSGAQIGVVERAWSDGKNGYATIRFSKNPDAEQVFQDVVDGIIRNVSVGYRVYQYREISGGEGQLSTYEATDWEPYEISMVSVPADYNAGVRSDDSQKEQLVKIFKLNNREMPETPEQKAAREAAEQAVAAEATRTAAEAAERVRIASENNTRAAVEAERTRGIEIRKAVNIAKLPEAFAETLISEGKTIDEARKLILDEFAKNDPHKGNGTVAVTGEDEKDKIRNAVIAGLFMRSSPSLDASKEFKPEVIQAAREHRGKTLLDIAKECLTRAAIKFDGLDKMEIVQRAITSSTSDFPILLSGLNRQILLAAYNAAPDTWRSFCLIGSVADFRPYRRLRFGTLSNLDSLAENGEYKNKKLNDAEYESIEAGTKGNLINLSRKMIINDDLSGLSRLTSMLGRAAARTIETDVYALFALNSGNGPTLQDGNPLFHSSHGNIAGTAAAPTVASFDAIRTQMKQIKDQDGNDYLDIMPAIWLGPTALGSTARTVNDAQYDVDLSNKFQVPNRSKGMFGTMIDSPRLSGNAWYAMADPANEPVFEVVFLDGNQSPYLESEIGFDVDGIRWKIRHDYGTGAIGHRGIIKNAGA
jgi:HK97 family phage prohead protease